MQTQKPKNYSQLAKVIIYEVLGLAPTQERLTKMEGVVEDFLLNKFPTPEKIYEQNCSMARVFIEDQLGLAPTPERIERVVEVMVGLEKH